ncbi:MAG: hypothetical protein J0L51_02455 [Rhizobiales bacterium]|jgi:hypothetical protein|nr:hypothetical protein [Hyphomicrobiales bacterium]
MSDNEKPRTLTAEEKARQKRRSRAIGLAVAGLVALFYVITIFKMGPAIMNRPL